jgi:hypothetical protein
MRITTSGIGPIRIRGNGTRGGYVRWISSTLIRKDEFGAPAMPEGLATWDLSSTEIVRRHSPFIFEDHDRGMANGAMHVLLAAPSPVE